MSEKKLQVRQSKQTRLLNSDQFDLVFKSPTFRISNQYVLLLARETSLPYARLGLVVAKKKIPLAVNRNRFKRLARELFRESQATLSSLDLVILSRSDISSIPQKEQYKTFSEIFSKLKKISNEK